MLKKSIMVIAILCLFFLTGCYSLSMGNPTKKYDYVFDEVLGEWEVVDKETETENTNDTVPIIPLYKTSTTWKIQYSDHNDVKRILTVNNGENLAFYLLQNIGDTIESEIKTISPNFTDYVFIKNPYSSHYSFYQQSFKDIYSKYKNVFIVKNFNINTYFKGNPVYIEVQHNCHSENEENIVQCKKEIDEFIKKVPYINIILLSAGEYHYYVQGEEVSIEMLESHAGVNYKEKYKNLLKDRFPEYHISTKNT
jgi:hypothetical protein